MTPCSDWIEGSDVAACCDQTEAFASDPTIFDAAALAAQDALFELSARRYPGECESTVRPCRTQCGCGFQVLSRGHIVWRGNDWWCDSTPCGCRALSRVKLAGSAIHVTEVKVDGVVVDPTTYRLDSGRYLTRVRADADDTVNRWPACQLLDLPDTEPGTFSIAYTHGEDPPTLGVQAASQLACEVYKECAGEECNLPRGWARTTRQGVTVERNLLTRWAFQRSGATGWNTGLPLVDAFLNMANPSGIVRRPVFWSPAPAHQYPLRVGAWPST